MDKKLPKVFVNKINNLNVNEKVFNSSNNTKKEDKEYRKVNGKNIYQKINSIFNSREYVYKANVLIETENGQMEKTIIGKNSLNLITIDNELIPISSIKNISKK